MGYGSITKEEAQRREQLFKQGIRVCGTCKRELSFDMFTKDTRNKYGLSSLCKDCQREQRKRRKDKIDAWFENNQERVKEQQRQYSKEHSEEKRKYNQDNKEYFKQKRKEYEQNNKEKVKQQRQRYRRSLKGRYKKYQREAEERGFEFNLTMEEFDEITKQPCFYCGTMPEDDFRNKYCGIDRIWSDQGYSISNCFPCCSICNRMKSNHTLTSWLIHMKNILDHMEHNNGFVVLSKEEREKMKKDGEFVIGV